MSTLEIIREIGRVLTGYQVPDTQTMVYPALSPELRANIKEMAERDKLDLLRIEHERHEQAISSIYRAHEQFLSQWLSNFSKIINDSDLPVVSPQPLPRDPLGADRAKQPPYDEDIPF